MVTILPVVSACCKWITTSLVHQPNGYMSSLGQVKDLDSLGAYILYNYTQLSFSIIVQ